WLESSGFCGDALWICHFQSHLVPQPIQFSPLLPIHWQKKHSLARTQSDKELEMAQNMLQRFINAHAQAPVIISHAKTKNEEPLWPSPLLPEWTRYCPKEIHVESALLENIVQDYTIPLQDKSHLPKGGYQVLASLANCPFQAFANYRLHSQSLLQEEVGLNPSERGRMMHRALQYIWQELKDQHSLKQLQENDTKNLCLRAIDKTLTEFKDRPFSLDKLMITLERQQLFELIQPYLEWDKQREYFQIEGVEKSISLTIDDWSFELRYDRLDKLANGDLVMIDYKSKIPSPLPWEDMRPIHPQILMYALAQESIRYLLFVAINPKELKTTGFGIDKLEPYTLKTSKEPWENWQHRWYGVLKTLIEEFKSGNIAPTPLSAKTCRYCHNRDICRQESQAANEED
ncbi:MAG: 1 protein, partial [Pseudomonadota bacterium]|nr:1 protein [Pseudomonadota bacterium]